MDRAMSPKDRKNYLFMAERRAQPGSGSAPFEEHDRTFAFAPPQVRQLLGNIPFAIVGGLATRQYMPERMTLDIDVLIRPSDLPQAEKALRDAGCRNRGPLTIGGSTWSTRDGQELDLLVRMVDGHVVHAFELGHRGVDQIQAGRTSVPAGLVVRRAGA